MPVHRGKECLVATVVTDLGHLSYWGLQRIGKCQENNANGTHCYTVEALYSMAGWLYCRTQSFLRSYSRVHQTRHDGRGISGDMDSGWCPMTIRSKDFPKHENAMVPAKPINTRLSVSIHSPGGCSCRWGVVLVSGEAVALRESK